MACKISYQGNLYTNDEFKEFVESNIAQFSEYLKPEPIFLDASIDYSLDVVNALSSPKVREPNVKNLEGFLNDLRKQGVNKTQLEFVEAAYEPMMTKQDLIVNLAANMSYTVEIETTKQKYAYDATDPEYRLDGSTINQGDPTQNYARMTVPGGVNYIENEIRTPDIIPSIKGHASFATVNGIGWFRSDDKAVGNKTIKENKSEQFELGTIITSELEEDRSNSTATKTRRILEVQSDLFQKGRESNSLVDDNGLDRKREIMSMSDMDSLFGLNEEQVRENERLLLNNVDNQIKKENDFLQLLNKNNNWVTFFVKSIIQDSAKKGYEKILFPTGSTAAKVEGHGTMETFIEEREAHILDLNEEIARLENQAPSLDPEDETERLNQLRSYKNTRNTFQNEIKDAKAGKLKISSVANFYETTIFNILKKNKYNPNKIKDEYGNSWYEVELGAPEQVILDVSIGAAEVEAKIRDLYKPLTYATWEDGTIQLNQRYNSISAGKRAEQIMKEFGFPTLKGALVFGEGRTKGGVKYRTLKIDRDGISRLMTPQTKLFDVSLADLAEGLKTATKSQKKFEDQVERVAQESKKVQKKIGTIENETVRTRLRDALRLIQDPEKQSDLKNFVYFILEASETLKYYSEKLRNIQSLSVEEKTAELDRVKTISDNFKDLARFLNKEFRYIDESNEFKKLINSLNTYQEQIDTIYAAEAEELSVDILAAELSEDEQIALKSLQKEVKSIEAQIQKAKDAKSSPKFIKNLEDKLKELKLRMIKFVPDEENISDTFRGLRGDLSWITGNLRSVIAMGDPIISGFARKLKRGFDKIRRAMIPIRDRAYEVIRAYEAATGNNGRMTMSKYYEGLYQVQELARVEDGEVKKDSFYSLLSPFKEGFYNDKLEYETKIKNLKLEGASQAEIEKADKEYRDWLSKYAERRYVDAWYDRYNLLTPEAEQARQLLIDDMNNILRGPNRDSLSEADMSNLHELKYRMKRLGSLRNEDGSLKTGQGLEIAQSIQAFNKKTAEMSYWETTDENQNWFNIILAKKKEQLAQGLITQDDYDRWFSMNTQRLIKQEFYKERQVIVDTIQSIMGKLPKEQFKEDIKKLWEGVFDVSRPYRDDDNIMDATEMNNLEVGVVKTTEEAIEELKRKLIRFSGLTVDEEQELQGLWGSLESLTPEEINRFMELRDQKKAYQTYIKAHLSDAEYTLLMSSFAQLADISKWQPTQYYVNTYNEKLHEFRLQVDPGFLEDLTDIEEDFRLTPWYTQNHITKTKKVVDDDGGVYVTDVTEPLYVWKDIIPTNPDYIVENAPGFAFKTRIVKPEFLNPNYKLDGKERVLPKAVIVEDGEAKASPYVNEDYERLRIESRTDNKAKAKWDMLQFLTATHLEGQQKAPSYKRLGYFLPGVMKPTYDRVLDRGVSGTVQAVKNTFIKTQEDTDLTLGDTSQIELSVLPIKYSTQVAVDDQNLNLAEIVLKHRAANEEHEFLESQLPEANIIQSSLKSSKDDISESQVQKVIKRLGFDKFIKPDKESRRSKVFNEFVRTLFYGESETAFPEIFSGLNTNKLINNVLGVASAQIMTINFPAHLTNLISGEIQNVIEAVGGRYFTVKDYLKAKSIYMANVHNFWGDYKKEGHKSFWGALADRLDVPQGEFIDNLGRKTNFSRLREFKSHVMIIKQTGEHEMQVSTMIAMSNNFKVKWNDDIVSLHEALEYVDGQIKVKDNVTNVDGSQFTEADLNKFENRVHAVVRQLNGAYSRFDKTMAEKTMLGKLAFYMRKYFMPMFFRRFETFKYDYEEQEYKEGYYRTVFNILQDVVKFNTQLVKNWSTYKNSLTDLEKTNARRFMAELGIIGSIALLVMLMGGYDRDRELKGRWVYAMTLYQLMKAKSEAETFLPPFGVNEMTTLFSSPFAAASTLKTVSRMLNDFGNLVTGDPDAYFQRDYGIWKEGDLRLKADALKLIGFNGNFITPENLVKNFELRYR